MKSFNHARALFALALSLFVTAAAQASFTQVVTFGDSLSDRRNVFNTFGTPPAPYADGRFSDGPVWVEVLATGLGLTPAAASTQLGANFAWGGARTTVGTGAGNVPSLDEQVNQYIGAGVDTGALHTVLIGGNDINAVDGTTYTTTDLVNDAQAVAGIVQNLITAGVNNILIATVPNLGSAPACDGIEAQCDGATQLYNGNMLGALAGLDQSKLTYLDLYTISNDIVANPGTYGFTNVDDNCLTTAYTGPGSCDGHLFWDDLHPTNTAQALIGHAAVAAVVPVPAALPLLLSALLGLGAAKRARKA